MYNGRPNSKSYGLFDAASFNEFERPLTHFKVTPFFDAEYLRNGHSCHKKRIGNRTKALESWYHFE